MQDSIRGDEPPKDFEMDHTVDLAETLGMTLDAFLEVFGAGWRECAGRPDHDFDADPTGGVGFPVTPWHIAGEPPQLMLRVFAHGVFLSRPRGSWVGGTHDLQYEAADHAYVARHEIDTVGVETARRLQRSRRRSFQYCAYCRVITPPERLLEGVCHGCASTWQGLVF